MRRRYFGGERKCVVSCSSEAEWYGHSRNPLPGHSQALRKILEDGISVSIYNEYMVLMGSIRRVDGMASANAANSLSL